MLRKLTLLLDLVTPEGTIPAGTEHEVDEATYKWLMECYAWHRGRDAEKLKELEAMYGKDEA